MIIQRVARTPDLTLSIAFLISEWASLLARMQLTNNIDALSLFTPLPLLEACCGDYRMSHIANSELD